ncbi:hypothetical protein QWY75_07725 [Pontixanthobacter aestiaquae]|uniref:NADH-quinone oxidoreductase subunit E n=1 Tax=Pontixanthobacter aestiaquae TaxID=1509367 RepID=A0A844Z4S0_9SPHN|nr:hypothetical protein [Pontixanthobacter aestiaquae]MDN3646093.1 hypothetical protein [Pontixanthobacter aestiaquae]MXO82915.1 hypothetical protein [Pontixanthobacter aestiaquae]
MLSIIAANPLPFILAVLIGLATAWWAWAGSDAEETHDDEVYDEDEVVEDAAVEPEPEPQPEPAPEPEPEPKPVAEEVAEEVSVAPVAVAATAAAGVAAAAKAADKPPVPLTVAEIEDGPNIAAAIGDPDDLKRIKGIGLKLEDLCNSLGVSRFDQIAVWRAKDIGEVDAHLGNFKGRIIRDAWVAQAKLLAAGKVTEHKQQFGD